MEKLNKRADGFCETSDGRLGVVVTNVHSEDADGIKSFSFRPSITANRVIVEWIDDVAIFPADTAKILYANKWARNPSDEELEAHNAKYSSKPKKSGGKGSSKSGETTQKDQDK